MDTLTAADLLFALAEKLDTSAVRSTDPVERAEQVAVRDMLTAAGCRLRAGQDGELEQAVVAFAELGAAYFAEAA